MYLLVTGIIAVTITVITVIGRKKKKNNFIAVAAHIRTIAGEHRPIAIDFSKQSPLTKASWKDLRHFFNEEHNFQEIIAMEAATGSSPDTAKKKAKEKVMFS